MCFWPLLLDSLGEKGGFLEKLSLENSGFHTLVASESHRLLGFTLRVADSVGLGRGLKICISIKFSGGANTAGLGSVLGEPP